MTGMDNLAFSLADEIDTVNLGLENDAFEVELESPTQPPCLQKEETKSSDLEETNEQLKDEWWNYVNASVKSNEAEVCDNNNDNGIRPTR